MDNILEPPDEIDGAKVVWWAYDSKKPFFVMKFTNGLDYKPIHGFALCQYKSSREVYKFSCDLQWNVANDSVYETVEQALSDIGRQFQDIHWQKKE